MRRDEAGTGAMQGSAAGPGPMHTSASAHAKLPGSNEHMSLRLKAVGQQVFKICNRKGRLSGGEGGQGCRGARRERDGQRERGGNHNKKKKAFAALGNKRGKKRPFCCRWHRTGRNVTAKSGEVCPSRLEFARSRAAGGCVRAAGGVYAGTHRHTHIYICAHMYIYACLGGRGGVSLSGWGRGQGTACCAPGQRRITRTLGCWGKKKKRSFQASTWPNREPCRRQSNQRLPVPQSAVQCAAGLCRRPPLAPSLPRLVGPQWGWRPRSPASPTPHSALRGRSQLSRVWGASWGPPRQRSSRCVVQLTGQVGLGGV